jgi:hypothetical protein
MEAAVSEVWKQIAAFTNDLPRTIVLPIISAACCVVFFVASKEELRLGFLLAALISGMLSIAVFFKGRSDEKKARESRRKQYRDQIARLSTEEAKLLLSLVQKNEDTGRFLNLEFSNAIHSLKRKKIVTHTILLGNGWTGLTVVSDWWPHLVEHSVLLGERTASR